MPNRFIRSVRASAGMLCCLARWTASSMRTMPSVTENSECRRRWTKAGGCMGRILPGHAGGAAKDLSVRRGGMLRYRWCASLIQRPLGFGIERLALMPWPRERRGLGRVAEQQRNAGAQIVAGQFEFLALA